MTIKLNKWKKTDGETRVYINGTNRDHNGLYVYFAAEAQRAGKWRVSSRTCDLPAGRQSGSVYKKRDQDREAALEALRDIGVGDETPWDDIMAMAEGRKPIVEVME